MKNLPKNIFTPLNMYIRIPDLKNLCAMYGRDATLGSLLEAQMKNLPHKCPKCDGLGYTIQTFNTYPKGLPDSGWVDQMEDFKITCDVCDGNGYTKDKMIAKVIKAEYVKA